MGSEKATNQNEKRPRAYKPKIVEKRWSRQEFKRNIKVQSNVCSHLQALRKPAKNDQMLYSHLWK